LFLKPYTAATDRIAVAPMMAYTDRHCRYLLRLLHPTVRLYSEMVTAHALAHGDPHRLLEFDPAEHPVALQIGGADPELVANAARLGARAGYDEINLNVGCPSDRVQSGRFGACLMAEPQTVAEAVRAMRAAAGPVPVTVKCRIGIDDRDDYEFLVEFVDTVAAAGIDSFVVHARKALLSGLSPKQNREIPPLRYDVPLRLKRDRPALRIVLNGGLRTAGQVREWLPRFDGVMLGRQAYQEPYLLAELRQELDGVPPPARESVVLAYADYVDREIARGQRPSALLRHALGLYSGRPAARAWRRAVQQGASTNANGDVLRRALASVERRIAA
jgi:tRNA-dihydrouridine synthase A